MADRPTVTTLGAGARYDTATLNTNFTALRDEFDNILGVNGTSGSNNTATGDWDLDGFTLRNVGSIGLSGGVSLADIVGYAEEWANKAEDSLVSVAAGGDGATEYSSLHWAAKAAADAVSTAADAASAAASAVAAAASAAGWANVTTLTTGTHNLETTDARDYYILDASGGTITVNLPAIGANDGILYGFEVANVDNAITIVRDGTDNINGVAGNYSGLTTVGDVVHFISDDNSPDNWLATLISRVLADESSLTKSGSTMSIKALGVDTAELAANAVTAAKADVASQIQAEAGTDTTTLMNPLRTAQAIAALGSAGGGWAFVSSQTASADATIAFTNMESGYDYLYSIEAVQPGTDSQRFEAQLGIAGPTYRTAGYLSTVSDIISGGANTSDDTTLIGLTRAVMGTAADEFGRFDLELRNPAGATDTYYKGDGAYIVSDGTKAVAQFGGFHTTAEAMTSIQFFFASGNIAVGEFLQYRRARA